MCVILVLFFSLDGGYMILHAWFLILSDFFVFLLTPKSHGGGGVLAYK